MTRHVVRDSIQERILSGRYEPQSKLVQGKIAKEFGVARGVVREALMELVGCGLVETIDNRGICVGVIDPAKILESYDLREVVEGLAARLCCGRASSADLQKLRELANGCYRLAIEGKDKAGAVLDSEFHRKLIRVSGNGLLQRMIDLSVVLTKIVHLPADPKRTLDGHLAVVDAIEQGAGEEAERMARGAVSLGKAIVEKYLSEGKCLQPQSLVVEQSDFRGRRGPARPKGGSQ